MGSSDERRLRAVVEQVTARAGVDLEDLTVHAAGRRRIVRVVIDGDDGVSLDDAAAVSRAISDVLDADQDDPMGSAPYALEVTSPGIGRPLTLPRHFRRARTRLVSITTTDGHALTGHVLDATDTGLALLTGKSGTDRVDVSFDTIARAKVEVEFSAPSAAVRELLGISDLTGDVTGDDAGDDAGDDNADIDELDDSDEAPDEAPDEEHEPADLAAKAPLTDQEAHR
jgi:ribosome maturation factor RimP